MPKAILELEMPRNCKNCPLKYYLDYSERNYPWEDYVCTITGKGIADKGRRSDCPLKLVVRGKWKLYGNDDDSGMSYWCTVCNFQLSEDLFYSGYKNGRWVENGVFKYCPNCGAKMEAEPSKPG